MAGLAILSPSYAKNTPELDFQAGHELAERRLRVLIVDDNPYLSELMAVLLRSDGHEVHIARDGARALELVRAYPPAVVLLDIDLPVMNGYEVASRLRAGEDTRHIFLAAVSGYVQNDRDDTHDPVFDCYLVKPVDPEQLRRLLAFDFKIAK
jgi:CheY-like chemotaxis protein